MAPLSSSKISESPWFFPQSRNSGRRGIQDQEQEVTRQYKILSAQEIYEKIHSLAQNYPSLVTLETSQKRYGLPTAGKNDECEYEEGMTGCQNWILNIEDPIVNPPTSNAFSLLPEVFLSGALHGNERVGPTSVVETASLLLEAASCESQLFNSSQLASCRRELDQKGIYQPQRAWLSRLVSTRRLVIVPTANALGYYRNQRTEDGIDPNRDFPYDLVDYTQCMKTIAGRTINEIFRNHMFQLSLTFHGGMEAIGYEWGAPSYKNFKSPDHFSQVDIASAYSRYAGKASGRTYPYGEMNPLVYPVRGGMEDWAYAASWDLLHTDSCKPNTHGGYDSAKTVYENSTLRMFNMLVETSNRKTPLTSSLGGDKNLLLHPNSEGGNEQDSGHIARNIRLSLLAVDAVQPWLKISTVGATQLDEGTKPMMQREGISCVENALVSLMPDQIANGGMRVPHGSVSISWVVGGAFSVDETYLYHMKFDQNDQASWDWVCHRQPSQEWFERQMCATESQSGVSFWHENSDGPQFDRHQNSVVGKSKGPSFSDNIDLGIYEEGDIIMIFAVVQVDKDWRNIPDKVAPNLPPQSHIVNARTDPNWHFAKAGKEIQGRTHWTSLPILLSIDSSLTNIDIPLTKINSCELTKAAFIEEKIDHPKHAFFYSGMTFLVVLAIAAFRFRHRKLRLIKKNGNHGKTYPEYLDNDTKNDNESFEMT